MRSADAAPRRGFILPTTMLVMVLLTVMLTAAFVLASAEFRATDNSLASNRALTLAQAGLEDYFSQQRNLDTGSTYDSMRISFSSGYADVVGVRVRATTGGRFPLWLVRSIGTSTDPRQPGQPQGQRAVAQLAELNSGQIPAGAAITAVNGIQMVGSGPNPIKGTNTPYSTSCTIPASPLADTAAFTVPSVASTGALNNLSVTNGTTYHRSNGNFASDGFAIGMKIVADGFLAGNNGTSTVTGVAAHDLTVTKSPNLIVEGVFNGKTISAIPGGYVGGAQDQIGTGQFLSTSVYDAAHIDWQGVLDGNFTPDFTGTLPPVCTGTCTYNSYYWTSSVTVPVGQRRGMLVAAGDVRLDSGAHWDGIIITGGRLMAYGGPGYTFALHGMAVTGLGCGTGSCPATQDSIQRGTALAWDYCYTHSAVGALNGLVPMKNTWVDQWSLY